jgi:hypothetical protein
MFQRIDSRAQAALAPPSDRTAHLSKVDELHGRGDRSSSQQQLAGQAEADKALRGRWVVLAALASRLNCMRMLIKNERDGVVSAELALSQAAMVVQKHFRAKIKRMRAMRRQHAGHVLLRTLRRNVVIQKQRRVQRAARLVLTFLVRTATVQRMLQAKEKLGRCVVVIQRAVRRHLSCHAARLVLATRQWDREEARLLEAANVGAVDRPPTPDVPPVKPAASRKPQSARTRPNKSAAVAATKAGPFAPEMIYSIPEALRDFAVRAVAHERYAEWAAAARETLRAHRASGGGGGGRGNDGAHGKVPQVPPSRRFLTLTELFVLFFQSQAKLPNE